MRILLSLLLILTTTTPAGASPKKSGNELVQAKLLADVSSIEPGKPFTVGVMLKIEPAWHVYWINPGDAGAPTTVKFDLPPGFTASDIQFPAPKRHTDPGDIVSFGYEDEVMLQATITPPKHLNIGQQAKITAHIEWLVCEKICLPGEADASIELPVAEKRAEANSDIFEKWRARIPVSVEKASGIEIRAASPIDLSKGDFNVEVFASEPIADVFSGPLDGAIVTTRLRKLPRGSVVVVTVSPLPGQRISAKFLELVLVDSANKAFDLKIPIVGNPTAEQKLTGQK